MIHLETEEVGTRKWFPIITYTPGTDGQHDDATTMANALRALGLHARVTREERVSKRPPTS